MSYREAKALKTLTAEINAAAPRRSKASDGWIGDPAHAARSSDHNPSDWPPNWTGVVRARDFTHDPEGGLDCDVLARELAELMREGEHPALGPGAYIIWEDRILSTDRLDEGWRDYSGSNEHRKHLHLSVARAVFGYDSTLRWDVLVPDVKEWPARIERYLAESKVEVERLRKAREAAIARGEDREPYDLAIKRLRNSRRAAKQVPKR